MVFGLFLIVLAWASFHWFQKRGADDFLQARSVSAQALGSGDLAATLRQLGHFQRLPFERRLQVMGRSEGADAYSIDPLRGEPLAELLMVDPQWLARPISVVSVLIAPEDFETLTKHSLERGRAWEKPAHFALLRHGELVFDSPVGLRIHGGGSRQRRSNSLRLYFRGAYDSDPFAPAVFPGNRDAPLRQLVVRLDGGPGPQGHHWQFISPLAYDIGRRVGIEAPLTEPAAVFVNGRYLGVRALTEYLDKDFLEARYGHDRFVVVRTKVNRNAPMPLVRAGDPRRYDQLLSWLRSTDQMTMEAAALRVDLDNLSRWFLTILVCATNDRYQGLLILDETQPGARWRWILWDLDTSFGLPHGGGGDYAGLDTLRSVVEARKPRTDDPRVMLLRDLLEDSPEFRQYFLGLFCEVMNHRLTPRFFEARLQHYRRLAVDFGLRGRLAASAKAIEEFLAARPAILRQHLGRLAEGPASSVEVRGPAGVEVEIDGYRRSLPYRGWYFTGLSMRVEVPRSLRASFSHWRVDGRDIEAGGDKAWTLTVAADTVVEAVFDPWADFTTKAATASRSTGVEAPETSPPTPVFDFDKRWSWIESLPQTPEKRGRWLERSRPGEFWVAEIDQPGKVVMSLLIPKVDPGRLIYLQPAEQPTVRLHSSCGGADLWITGEGNHPIEIEVVPPPADLAGMRPAAVCKINVVPNFYVDPRGENRRLSVAVFDLEWVEIDEEGLAVGSLPS